MSTDYAPKHDTETIARTDFNAANSARFRLLRVVRKLDPDGNGSVVHREDLGNGWTAVTYYFDMQRQA